MNRLVCFIGIIFALGASSFGQQWMTVRSEARFNISGMAVVSQTEIEKKFIVVHDNKDRFEDAKENPKKNKTERAGLLIVGARNERPRYEKLKWIDEKGTEKDLPIDLESISAIPEKPLHYVASVGFPNQESERGRVFYLVLDEAKKEVRVLKSFKIPTDTKNRDFEGLDVQKIGGKLYAFWTDRGKNETAATLFWGELDLEKGAITAGDQKPIKTTLPKSKNNLPDIETRSISEIKIDNSGAVFVSSALDGGDLGPFASAFFLIGTFDVCEGKLIFRQSPSPIKLFEAVNYKIEAFEFVGGNNGGVIFGTDDEDFGASVYFNWF